MTIPAVHLVRTPAELRALASPPRQDVLEAIQALQPCSVREIGRYLGRLPVSLYYHLRKLEEVGLVVEEAQEGPETLYRLPARRLRVRPDKHGKSEVESLRKIGAGMFRRAQRLHEAACAREPIRDRILGQRTVRLTRRGFDRVQRELHRLFDVIDEERAAKGDTFYTVTLHLVRNPAHGER